MSCSNRPATRLATRLAFLAAGFGVACWAPLVPFAKQRLGVDDGILSILILCLGSGSVVSMTLAGILNARLGSKTVIIAGGLGIAITLPFLSAVSTPILLGVFLFILGIALGSLDVAMNVHAVEVERDAQRPLMSGFHALYSVGGFVGSAFMTLLLSLPTPIAVDTLICSLLIIAAILLAWPRLLARTQGASGPAFALPRGTVLGLAAIAIVLFLVEGAMLDWSALLMTEKGLVGRHQSGIGYSLFAIAMTSGRLVGDRLSEWLGDRAIITFGGTIGVVGFVLLLAFPCAVIALPGCLLIGFGASNIVPTLFRRAGRQTAMPLTIAVAAIASAGYAGMLIGPVAIGFTSSMIGLPRAFWILACLMAVVSMFSGTIVEDAPLR